MPDLIEQLERAMDRFLQGRPEEAVDLGQSLLARSRGTPHAASVHRHQAEFLHAMGHYETARQVAQEAGNLARATRHPTEILAATLTMLACDLYEGQISAVHQQLTELMELAPRQPMVLAFLARLLLLVGDFERAIAQAEAARASLDEATDPGGHPLTELGRADLLLIEARAELSRDAPRNAIGRLQRVIQADLISLVPGTQARALLGLAQVQTGDEDSGRELAAQAIASARKISADLHGVCLVAAGRMHTAIGELGLANEQLRVAAGLLVHPLERQEVHHRLGRLALEVGERTEAEQSFRRATEPTTETHFGRLSVQALHRLIGLRTI